MQGIEQMGFLKVAFLCVGHGDSSVIIFPDGKTGAVIDTPKKAEVIINYLNEKRISSLEWIIISHTHEDHAGGIVNLIKNFKGKISRLYYNRDTLFKNQENRNYKILLDGIKKLKDQGIIVGEAATTSSTFNSTQNVTAKIFYPSHDDITSAIVLSKINDASVVVKISFGKFSVLFTGDLSEQGWKWLKVRKFDLKSDILKYPHHGGWFESIPELIDSVNPEYVILSYGETSKERYGLPADETIAYLKQKKRKIFSTLSSHQEFIISSESIKHHSN